MEARRAMFQSLKTGLISLAVFLAGVCFTGFEFSERRQEQREEQLQVERDAARKLHFELQRRLDQYENANRDLAALFSASEIQAHEFHDFLLASRFRERLGAFSFVGYLPKVSRSRVAEFQREVRKLYPHFEIRGTAPDADYAFPLLYAEHEVSQESVESLRGLDYGSHPVRLNAMRRAAEYGRPTATRVQWSSSDPNDRLVLIFTPIRDPEDELAPIGQRLGQVDGFTVSVLRVDDLLASLYAELGVGNFSLKMYDGVPAADTLIYDSDRAGESPKRELKPVYTAELEFANQQWSSHFFPVLRAQAVTRYEWLLLAIGIIVSGIAAYAAILVQRLLIARREGEELLDRFDSFFENHPFSVTSIDTHWRIVHANQKLARELGMSQDALVGRSIGDFLEEGTRKVAYAHFQEALRGQTVAYNIELVDPHGKRSIMSVMLIPLSAGGKTTHVLAFAENITERKRAEAELHASRQMLRLILDTVPQRIFWKDLNGAYLGGNRNLLEDAGLDSVEELVGKTDYELPWPEMAERYRSEDAEVMATGVPRLRSQHSMHRRNGEEVWIESSKLPLVNDEGKPVGVLGVAEDITERKATEQELFRRANYDSLTSLPNRAHFYSHLGQTLKRASRHRATLALMYFDIDHFKQFNDTYGHDVGDEVIRTFADRVRLALRDEDFVARLGGDEFILVAENLADEQSAEVIAEKLVASMAEPFKVNDLSLSVSTSIGIAYFRDGMTADQLVKVADDAMYEAKRAGRNCYRRAG